MRTRKTVVLIKIIMLLIIILNLSIYAHAQQHSIRFHRISIEDGLSQSDVYCILQDRKGFMWFGTEDGLNRYDGYNFKVYKHDSENPHSLSNNQVYSIHEDRSGTLWIGTNGGGLNQFDPVSKTFIRYRHDPNKQESLSSDQVNNILEDSYGNLWIGTWGGGLDLFDRKEQIFIHYDNKYAHSYPQIFSILEDHRKILWIGSSNGLFKYDRKTVKEKNFQIQNQNAVITK